MNIILRSTLFLFGILLIGKIFATVLLEETFVNYCQNPTVVKGSPASFGGFGHGKYCESSPPTGAWANWDYANASPSVEEEKTC